MVERFEWNNYIEFLTIQLIYITLLKNSNLGSRWTYRLPSSCHPSGSPLPRIQSLHEGERFCYIEQPSFQKNLPQGSSCIQFLPTECRKTNQFHNQSPISLFDTCIQTITESSSFSHWFFLIARAICLEHKSWILSVRMNVGTTSSNSDILEFL